MECNSLKNGQCMVASEIAGEIAIASASTCAACQKDENPMTANKPTCGLAIVALHNAGHFDRKEHHYIVECAIHPVKGGPGTELERILSWAFKKSEGCDCDAHKSAMNVWGPDECEKRMPKILKWLRTEAEKKGIPFFEPVVKAVVRKAISNARRNLRNQS